MQDILNSSSVGFFVAEKDGEHLHGMRRMNGFENNAIPARDFAVGAFVILSLQRLYESAKRVLFERGDVVEDTVPPGGFALSCLAAPSWMWTIQVMPELCERNELSLAHLALRFFHESAFFGGEHIVRINHAAGLESAPEL